MDEQIADKRREKMDSDRPIVQGNIKELSVTRQQLSEMCLLTLVNYEMLKESIETRSAANDRHQVRMQRKIEY